MVVSPVPNLKLNNGFTMPAIGYGTWQSDNLKDLKVALNEALKIGYRCIDTAAAYKNEQAIGEVLNEWINNKKLLKRDDVFITTKLQCECNRPEEVSDSLEMSLKNLKTTYVDMYLIHLPIGFRKGFAFDTDDFRSNLDLETDIVALWKAMENEVDKGTAKSIGLSNFNREQIDRIMKNARIRPANLQIELNLFFRQRELVDYCKSLGIQVTSFASLGSSTSSFSAQKIVPLVDNEILKKVASEYNKTPAQIALKVLVDDGMAIIPKSLNAKRIRENFEVMDIQISEKDRDLLYDLNKPRGRVLRFDELFPGSEYHPEFPHSRKSSLVGEQ